MLKEILDFDNFKTSREVSKKLEQISKGLFYNSHLYTSNKKYVITQIELFFSQRTNKNLSTEKCNKHSYQSTSGKFYIHKTLKNNRLKSPKHIGLDISCGKEFERYGGILIRGIRNLETEEEILGPSNVLNELIGNTKKLNKKFSKDFELTLFRIDGLDIYKNGILRIEKLSNNTPLFANAQIIEHVAISQYSKLFASPLKKLKKAS